MIHYTAVKTALGAVLIGATEKGICLLQFAERGSLRRQVAAQFPQEEIAVMPDSSAPRVKKWTAALNTCLKGRPRPAGLPLDIRGTVFQKRVWRYLQTIPPGETRSYAEVARAAGRPRAVRAAASACANNRAALVIPCHRVIRSDGSLAGYRWGLARKRTLLALEKKK